MITRCSRNLIKFYTNPAYTFKVWNDIPMGPPDPVLGNFFFNSKKE